MRSSYRGLQRDTKSGKGPYLEKRVAPSPVVEITVRVNGTHSEGLIVVFDEYVVPNTKDDFEALVRIVFANILYEERDVSAVGRRNLSSVSANIVAVGLLVGVLGLCEHVAFVVVLVGGYCSVVAITEHAQIGECAGKNAGAEFDFGFVSQIRRGVRYPVGGRGGRSGEAGSRERKESDEDGREHNGQVGEGGGRG